MSGCRLAPNISTVCSRLYKVEIRALQLMTGMMEPPCLSMSIRSRLDTLDLKAHHHPTPASYPPQLARLGKIAFTSPATADEEPEAACDDQGWENFRDAVCC